MNIWLNFRDIEYVRVIAKTGNLTQAAKELHISQPALSIYINKLEERIGTPLFDRVGKKFWLTYAGQCIISGGHEILNIRDSIQVKINDIINGKSGRLRVGFPFNSGPVLIPSVLKKFHEIYPDIEVILCEDDAKVQIQKIIEGDLDIIFLTQNFDEPLLDYQVLCTKQLVLYVSQDSPLIAKSQIKEGFKYPWIDFNLCKDMKFISHYPTQGTYQIGKTIFERYNFEPNVAIQVKNQLTAIQLAAIDYGIYLTSKPFSHNISITDTKPPVVLSIGNHQTDNLNFIAAWRKDVYLPKIGIDFINIFKEIHC